MNTKVLFSIVTNFTFNGIKRLRNPHLGDKFYMHTEELTLMFQNVYGTNQTPDLLFFTAFLQCS